MHLKLTKHGRFCKQKQPTPYQTHDELKYNSNMSQTYQFERTTWWYLSVLESIMKSTLKSALKSILSNGEKNHSENHGLLKFALGPPLGGRPDVNSGRAWNLIHSLPCRTPCRFFIHEVFFGPLGLHLRMWSELGWSPPFRPMRALRLQWSWAFSLVCEVALSHPIGNTNDRILCRAKVDC